ncbi:MAG: DNA repair ATPase RecN [Psychroserpens sp.]|jgi:DNA repair ATPase RecN
MNQTVSVYTSNNTYFVEFKDGPLKSYNCKANAIRAIMTKEKLTKPEVSLWYEANVTKKANELTPDVSEQLQQITNLLHKLLELQTKTYIINEKVEITEEKKVIKKQDKIDELLKNIQSHWSTMCRYDEESVTLITRSKPTRGPDTGKILTNNIFEPLKKLFSIEDYQTINCDEYVLLIQECVDQMQGDKNHLEKCKKQWENDKELDSIGSRVFKDIIDYSKFI